MIALLHAAGINRIAAAGSITFLCFSGALPLSELNCYGPAGMATKSECRAFAM